jgi:hypothetical protein
MLLHRRKMKKTGGGGQYGVLKIHTVKCARVRQRWCWNDSETGKGIKFPSHQDEREAKEEELQVSDKSNTRIHVLVTFRVRN